MDRAVRIAPCLTPLCRLRAVGVALAAALAGAWTGAAGAAPPAGHPALMVTETGGFAQRAADRPVLALYPDGTAVIGQREGRVRPSDVSDLLARHQDALTAPLPSAPPCATDLPTAEITIRPLSVQGRSVGFYGLGVCDSSSPFARLVAEASALPLISVTTASKEMVAQVQLADGAPGPAARWRGPETLRPGGWVRTEATVPLLVQQHGHRFALLPRMLLPHERIAGQGPGDPVLRLATAPRGIGPMTLQAPTVLVRGDGTWFSRDPGGRWQTGDLAPADLDAIVRSLDSAGASQLGSSYTSLRGQVTTLMVRWGERVNVRASALVRGVDTGAYPEALGRVQDAVLAIRPAAGGRPLSPGAVRIAWRMRARPRGPVPSLADVITFARRSGNRILIGPAADRVWNAVGQRSYRGAVSVGRRGYLVAVEPVLG